MNLGSKIALEPKQQRKNMFDYIKSALSFCDPTHMLDVSTQITITMEQVNNCMYNHDD